VRRLLLLRCHPPPMRPRALAVTLVALAAIGSGCSSGSASPADAGADAAKGTVFGNVLVDVIKDQYTGFLGIFFDSPPPPTMPLDASQTQGGCQLFVPRAVSCAQACAAGSVCVGKDQCARTPTKVAVGTLHVEGLGP